MRRLLVLIATAVGVAALLARRQRERELDEAIWEQPTQV